MSLNYHRVWETMNDLEMVTSKIVSAREIIDAAVESIQRHEYDKAENLAMAAYEYLGYYLGEFDDKFKLAWKETVSKQKEEENDAWDAVKREKEYYEGWDTTATGEKFPRVCDKNDPSPECKKDWVDFWEETYYPEEYEKTQYTEEELDAMCEAAASQYDKDKCREYNLREAEYYDKRAKLDADYKKMKTDNLKKELEEIRAAGGFEWTPDPEVSRNDSTRLKYEEGWVYESPDRGKTVTRRRVGSLEKEIIKADGYSTSEKKTWTLPVEESVVDGVSDYYISFPDDLLKAANLKEGDTVEWVDRNDGSYELRKSLSCPPCPPCDTIACVDHLADD